ncbi:ABC transporter substrate-binding protein [Guggenheimella bovis]
MKKTLALLLALLLTFTLFAGCEAQSNGNTAGDTIKVGWIGSLTGDQAVWGTCEKQTLEMLIEEYNANGGFNGKKIELVALDSQGKSSEALNAANRLVSQDKVVAILGPNSSGQAIVIAPALENAKVPDIATVATNPKVTVGDDGKVKPYNFRVCFIDPYQGAVAAAYSIEKLNFKTAAVLYDQSDEYSSGMTEFFVKTFEDKGGKIVAKEAFNKNDVEFKTQLTKIKEANPDVLFMPYFYREVIMTAQQAAQLGMKITMFGGDGWPSEDLMKLAKNEVQGAYFVNHLDYEDPAVQSLKTKYTEKFGKAPEINGYLVNDAFLLFTEALKNAKSVNSADIKDALEKTEVQGITGKIKLDPNTHNPMGKDAAILRIEGDKYVFLERFSVDIK